MNLHLAYQFSFKNRNQIEVSKVCGCFHCLETFAPSEIEEWVDDGSTPLCPKCAIDSVLGSESGFAITKEFLSQMKGYWFL